MNLDAARAVAAALESRDDGAALPEMMAAASRALACDSAAFGRVDRSGRLAAATCPHTDPDLHRRYSTELHACNFLWQASAARPAGSAVSEAMLCPREVYLASPIYNEFIRPQGTDAVITLTLENGPDGITLLTLGRRRGRDGFSRDELAGAAGLAGLLGRVLARAIPAPAPTPARLARLHGLTPREAQIAAAIAAGHTLPEAAASLGITLSTARTHLNRVFDKTDRRSQTALAVYLREPDRHH